MLATDNVASIIAFLTRFKQQVLILDVNLSLTVFHSHYHSPKTLTIMSQSACLITAVSEIKSANDGRRYKTLRVQEMPFEMVYNIMTDKMERSPVTRTLLSTGFNVWETNINNQVNPVFSAYVANTPILGRIEKVTTEPYCILDENGDVKAVGSTSVFVNWDVNDAAGFAKQLAVEVKASGRVLSDKVATEEQLAMFLALNKDKFLNGYSNQLEIAEELEIDASEMDSIIAGATEEVVTPAGTPKGKANKPEAEVPATEFGV
jgi:hypothetical protein